MGGMHMCYEDGSLTAAAADEKRDFIFAGRKIVYVLDQKGTIWIKSKEIADILRFPDDEDITRRVNADEHAQFYSVNPNIIGGQGEEEIHPQTVFLNQTGIHVLVLQSENNHKLNLTRWIVNVVVPSIRQLEWKSKNQQLEELKIAYQIVQAENSGLKSEIRAKLLEFDEHLNAARMEQRYMRFLKEEKRSTEAALNLQMKDAEAMQRQIQLLITENRKRLAVIEELNVKIRNLEFKIRNLETENQSKDTVLNQGNVDRENMQSLIQDLEAGNRAKDETLAQELNKTVTLQNDILVLKNENSMLNLQAEKQQVTAEDYGAITRKQEILLHLLRENFIPKPYDKKLENQFLIFALNEDDFFPYYAVSIQNNDMNQQIKRIRTRHPNAVELLRIPFYSNAVNLLSLMAIHLKDKMRFNENFFVFRDNQYTDDDLKRDVLKLFNEAENTRQEVFQMTCIERDFRTTENKCPSENSESINATTTSGAGDYSTPDLNPSPADETATTDEDDDDDDESIEFSNPPSGGEEEDYSTVDSNPPPAEETATADKEEDYSTLDSNPPPTDSINSHVDGDNWFPPENEAEETYSELDPYEGIVHEANA